MDSDAHAKPITPRLRDDHLICCFEHGRMSQDSRVPSHSFSCRCGQHEPAFSVDPRRLRDCMYPGRPSNGSLRRPHKSFQSGPAALRMRLSSDHAANLHPDPVVFDAAFQGTVKLTGPRAFDIKKSQIAAFFACHDRPTVHLSFGNGCSRSL
jgi:hypothetical protein